MALAELDQPQANSPFNPILDAVIRRIRPGSSLTPDAGDALSRAASSDPLDELLHRIRVNDQQIRDVNAPVPGLEKTIGEAPTPDEMQAGQAGIDATSAMSLYNRLRGLPPVPAATLTAPRATPLTLPKIPDRTSAEPNGVAQLLSGIFGLASPVNAGQFGAAALHGAILKNKADSDAEQTAYQQDFQRQTALHADEQRRADVEAEIANENKRLKYDADVRARAGEMSLASEGEKASRLQGRADYLKGLVLRFRAARSAQADLAGINEQIKVLQRQDDSAEKVLRIMEIQQRAKQIEADRQNRELETVRHNQENEKLRGDYNKAFAGRAGYSMDPSGVVSPLPLGSLPLNVQSQIGARDTAVKLKGEGAPIHQEAQRATLWRTLHQPEITAAQTRFTRADKDFEDATKEADATQKAWDAWDKANPWEVRKQNGNQAKYDLGIQKHTHLLEVQKAAADARAKRDSLEAEYVKASTPPPTESYPGKGKKADADPLGIR